MPAANETALGLLETQGLVAAIEAADAMLKTAFVRLVSIEKTDPALITIQIVGEVAAVQASVDAGRAAAERIGKVISAHVIPRPDDDVRRMIKIDSRPEAPPAGRSLEALTVSELRAMAREIPDFPIQGRAVARARREELVEQLKRLR